MSVTLLEVKAFLAERRVASLSDLVIHFDTTPDAARQVLSHWLAKGKVRLRAGPDCKAGCSCSQRPDEIYEWVG